MERPAKERLIGAIVLVTVAWLLIPVFLDQKDPGTDRTVTRELTLPQPATDDSDPDAERSVAPMRRETVSLADDTPAVAETPPPADVPALPVPDAALTAAPDESNASTPPEGGPAATSNEPDPVETTVTMTAETTAQSPPTRPEPEPRDEPPGATDRAAAPATVAATTNTEPPPDSAPSAAPAGAGGSQLWAVQLGSFGDQANAQRLASQLRDEGLPAFLSRIDRDGRALHRVRIGPQATRAEAEAIAARVTASGQAAAVVPHP